ncbi:MAG: carboxypeptidase-like regulatory domain-containing protein, partial [Tannerella sp.]|nr:carboxypeptidase-like regulatory domain-containing protein [Tannerella sp.]
MKKNCTNGILHAKLKKWIRIMKATTFFLIVGISMLCARNSYSQSTLLTLKMTDRTIREVFDVIEQQSEFVFLYQTDALDENRKVGIDVTNQTVDKVLDHLFENTDNVYVIDDRQIYIARKAPATEPEQTKKPVSGTVKDSNGEPLVGVNVVEKGTTNGTATDANGNFTLNVADNARLLISYVGYNTQEINILSGMGGG